MFAFICGVVAMFVKRRTDACALHTEKRRLNGIEKPNLTFFGVSQLEPADCPLKIYQLVIDTKIWGCKM
jgi:hypothetical protein